MFRAAALLALFAFVVAGTDVAAAQSVGGRLKDVAANKTIRIAYRTDAIPFSFVEKNEPVGYTIDICKQVVASIGRQLGAPNLKVEWVPVTTQTRFEAVASGKADLECGSSTVTLARMKLVDFSNFVFVESTGLVVRNAAGIGALKDVAGKKIAVIAGTSNEQALVRFNQKTQANVSIVLVKDRNEAVAALEGGRVDGFANDKLLLVGSQFKSKDLRMLPEDLSIEPYAIVLPRGDWELRLAVNTGLAEVFRGEDIRKIFEKWFAQFGLQPGILLGSAFMLGALPD